LGYADRGKETTNPIKRSNQEGVIGRGGVPPRGGRIMTRLKKTLEMGSERTQGTQKKGMAKIRTNQDPHWKGWWERWTAPLSGGGLRKYKSVWVNVQRAN